MTGLVGGPLLVGGLGPGPPGLPLNPALSKVQLLDQGMIMPVSLQLASVLVSRLTYCELWDTGRASSLQDPAQLCRQVYYWGVGDTRGPGHNLLSCTTPTNYHITRCIPVRQWAQPSCGQALHSWELAGVTTSNRDLITRPRPACLLQRLPWWVGRTPPGSLPSANHSCRWAVRRVWLASWAPACSTRGCRLVCASTDRCSQTSPASLPTWISK